MGQHVPGAAPGEGVIVSAYVTEDLRTDLEELAKENERSVSAEARYALRNYVRSSRAEAAQREVAPA